MKETIAQHVIDRPVYEFIDSKIPVFLNAWIPTIGWVFAFYLSWSLAEQAIKRTKYFQHSLFAISLLSAIIIASISYCVEAAAIGTGWWRWTIDTRYMSNFVIGSPFVALEAWAFFGMHFLLTFFLIECSKFKEKDWKGVFFVIAASYHWALRFLDLSSPRIFGKILISLIFVLALTWPLKLECCPPEQMPIRRFKFNRISLQILANIPLFVSLFMLLILITIDIGLLHKPELLISCLPIIFFILLTIDKVPFWLLVLMVFGSILTFEKKLIITTTPIIIILIFKISSWIKAKRGIEA